MFERKLLRGGWTVYGRYRSEQRACLRLERLNLATRVTDRSCQLIVRHSRWRLMPVRQPLRLRGIVRDGFCAVGGACAVVERDFVDSSTRSGATGSFSKQPERGLVLGRRLDYTMYGCWYVHHE